VTVAVARSCVFYSVFLRFARDRCGRAQLGILVCILRVARDRCGRAQLPDISTQ